MKRYRISDIKAPPLSEGRCHGVTEGGETRTTFKLLGEVSSHRFHSSLYSTAVFNLNCSLVFFFKSFFQYFWKKVPKNMGSRVRHSMLPLFTNCQQHSLLQYSSVGAHLAGRSLSQCLGRQELATLKHHAACFRALLGCSLCLPTLPFRLWRRITFVMEFIAHNGPKMLTLILLKALMRNNEERIHHYKE